MNNHAESAAAEDVDSDTPSGSTAASEVPDLEKAPQLVTRERTNLDHVTSHISAQDMHAVAETLNDRYADLDLSIYEKFSPRRKAIITLVLSLCGLLAPISSTCILSAIPEVVATFNTTGTIIGISNACYILAMSISPAIWGPLSQIYGRQWICRLTVSLFFIFNICTALSPNLAAYFIFRIFTALQGTSFLTLGASCIGDIYKPTERGTAMAWFLSGTLTGPAFGPFIGGVIVSFCSWRVIFWFQAALAGLASTLVLLFLPETIHYKRCVELNGLTRMQKIRTLAHWTSPVRVVSLFTYPNILSAGFASSSITWNMYSLLTPIRYVINPRFHLTKPWQSGLFYLAPGCGYLTGTFFGGRYADHWVKKMIRKRKGVRVPEDRLNSCLPFMGIVIPGCMLIYGWTLEEAVGGIPLPVIVMFIQGVAQLFCFPSLNTYCVDVMQERSGEVVAGNYVIRYLFGALGTATVIPAIESIGVGWFSTVSACFVCASAVLLWTTTVFGKGWRENADQRYARKKEAKEAKRLAAAEQREMQKADAMFAHPDAKQVPP